MTKLATVIALALMISISVAGCTEQQIKPKATGGQVSDPTGTK